jgi:putative hemolysin
MDGRFYLEVLAILILILANGFLVLAEFSIIASRKTKLKQKAEDGKPGALSALKVHDNPENFLAAVQVGITLLGALVGVFSGATIVERFQHYLALSPIELFSHWAGPISVVTVVVSITILSAVLGELVPKFIALSYPEKYARWTAEPTIVFIKITYVFSKLLTILSKLILRLLGVRQKAGHQYVDEDEINHMIFEGREKGLFDITEEEFVKSVFQFTDAPVRRAMKPRPDVIAIDIDSPPDEIMKVIIENGYSRYPVYRENIDDVVGVIYVKDIIKERIEYSKIDIKQLMRTPLFVPDSTPLTKLLRNFQEGKNHLAIVLDEYGGTAGIITLEDIIEELVGEIQDEYDSEAPPIVKYSDQIAYANGTVWPGEINEVLDTDLPEDQAETLAGLFIDIVGRMPEKFENIQIADAKMTILAKDKQRILRVKIEKLSFPDSDNHNTENGKS